MIEENELPQGWSKSKLAEVCYIERGITFPGTAKSYKSSAGTIVCLRTTNVQNYVDWNNLIYVPESYVKSKEKLLRKEDILISMANSKELVGKVSFVNQFLVESTFGGFIAVIRSYQIIEPKYLFYYLRSDPTQSMLRGTASQTVNIANLSLEGIYSTFIPVAPRLEQQRIVEAIEQQFSRLDKGVVLLRQAQKKLKLYRASVLKAAVEGELTAEWRKSHTDVEPASELLKRILAERRAKWEEEQIAKGKDPQKVKYVEPAEPDVSRLPELPEGWCWTTIEQVCDRIVDCLHSTPKFTTTGFLCVDTNCIKPGRIIFEKVRYVDKETFTERNQRMEPQKDDIMFSREGALLGIAVRVPANLQFCLGQRMMIFRLAQGINSQYYEAVLNSFVFRSQYIREITGTASPHLNIQDTRGFSIPLLSSIEQEQIVLLVEERLSIIRELEITIEKGLKQAERQRQSILQRAFTGRLVAQDLNDEPASVLLERIRREREERQMEKQVRGTQSKKPATKPTRAIKMPEGEAEPFDMTELKQESLWQEEGEELEETEEVEAWRNVEA